eukprot:CAMPEP_0194229794 /NCGR_PEP_ID=MMETSP0156-20130528/44075_1 /TAXON_ID=33649 /ORGANISM="Thalassionema nitzschioides, Strain L26-B" /LENGTH=203 /DNA_ID=CAMNT_0038962353 /DNA_START=864 /DNA_END=1472 /DNA_ORIENTATION=+
MNMTDNNMIEQPGKYDVISNCRTQKSFEYVGNRRFRLMVENHAIRYEHTKSKLDRGIIVMSILETIQGAGGNFIRKRRKDSNLFETLSVAEAREKIGHALRDAIAAKSPKRDLYSILGGNRSSFQLGKKRRLSLVVGRMGNSSYFMIKELANSTRQSWKISSATPEQVQNFSNVGYSSYSDEDCYSTTSESVACSDEESHLFE